MDQFSNEELGVLAIAAIYIVLSVVWIVLPFIVNANRGHVKEISRLLRIQNEILKDIRRALWQENPK